jgi:hypothetical protein
MMASTSAMTRPGAVMSLLEGAVDHSQWARRRCNKERCCVWAPPMVERTAPTYEVGWVGDDDTTIGAANGGIVGDEALLSIGSNTSAVPCSTIAWCCTVPPISWRLMSTTNTIAAVAAVSRARLAASLLLADAFVANAIAYVENSTAAASQNAFFWALYSANSTALLASSRQHPSLANTKSPTVATRSPTPSNNAHQQEAFPLTLQRAPPSFLPGQRMCFHPL